MRLSSGSHLGPYEIVALLGSGGMGEVYRARDLKLAREVALKLLPEHFLHAPDQLARFKREAQILASLTHPHIGAIHGLEEFDGTACLVLELIEGQTFGERLQEGPLPIDEALSICRQVAEGLEAAHAKGIVHRDLKPHNIKVTPGGIAKILDFGLARDETVKVGSGSAQSRGTSQRSEITLSGTIIGTAGYMSPEQVRGKAIDKRSDIWSFGCVLYEALTGQRAFPGETPGDSLVSVLQKEPDWGRLPPNVPANIRVLLRRCLDKSIHRRLHDIADARIELEDALAGRDVPDSSAGESRRVPRWKLALPWVLAGIMTVVAAIAFWNIPRQQAALSVLPTRSAIVLPPDWSLPRGSEQAFSQDGRRLAFVAKKGSDSVLYVRPIDLPEATPVPGTEGAYGPFFSPDGEWLGFFAGGRLKKVALAGGTPTNLADAPNGRGGSWGSDDRIIFSPSYDTPLYRVASSGGAAQAVTSLDQQQGETSHRWPEILPDGKTVLFTVAISGRLSFDDANIVAQSLETGKRSEIVKGGSYPRYIPTGHLLYARGGKLMAIDFDPLSLKTSASALSVLEELRMWSNTGAASFSLSGTGMLAYTTAAPGDSDRTLVWVDRKGAARDLAAPPRFYTQAQISPDGKQIAVQINSSGESDLWKYDLENGELRRITFGGRSQYPIWTADGTQLTFSAVGPGRHGIATMQVDGGGNGTPLVSSRWTQIPGSWSHGAHVLAFAELNPTTRWDVWVRLFDREGTARPLLQGPYNEGDPHFSPNGQWLAYSSNESGRDEIYVVEYPGLGRKWQVSTDGGAQPVWSPLGRELFYRMGNRMMAVEVSTAPTFKPGRAALLFEASYESNYDVAPDGSRFLMIRRTRPETAVTRINLITGWFEEMKRLNH